MIPNLGRLSLHDVANTMGFYEPTEEEQANMNDDPVTLEKPVHTMTFRVRLLEAEQEPEEEKGEPGDEGKAAAAVAGGRQQRRRRRRRTELRRMCATISIFLYVRLYAVMRGMGGMLRAQKYSLAVMTAGTAMMPVGWTRLAFPAYFWVLMAYNGATAGETLRLVRELGVDGPAKKQMHLA